uniref:hypothetical protein n=2 Tax=Bacteroidales TaxID=171549 RepID=UPI00321AA733
MPNWCTTAYVIEGDAQEIKSLYELMKDLQDRKTPAVKNGFGTSWLGCLVDALGKDWDKVSCRGDWANLEMVGETLRFTTETAWGPCNETFDLVCEKFPSFRYYYQTEEPGMGFYETNDSEGKYFTDKYIVDLCTVEGKYFCEYFADRESLFAWLGEVAGKTVRSEQDAKALFEEWAQENPDSCCSINEY